MHVFVCSYYNAYVVLLDQTSSCKLWLLKLKEAAILLCLYLTIIISGRISKMSFITSELKRDGKL